eukprot:Ihof_evm1s256 gene=Ihof_evmTU1s256
MASEVMENTGERGRTEEVREEEPVLEKLRKDDTYAQFLVNDFDLVSFTANVVASSQVESCLATLLSGIQLLDDELHRQVVERHEDLIQQATGIQKLEGVVGMINTRVSSLQTSIERIRGKIDGPYLEIVEKTRRLSRLQNACELVRGVIRFLYVTQRLKSQLENGDRELAKAASSLHELAEVGNVDLSGITVVDQKNDWIREEREKVYRRGYDILHKGIEGQNQADIGTALQVFYNMGQLQSTITSLLNTIIERVSNEIKGSLEQLPSGPRSRSSTPRSTPAPHVDIWEIIERVLGALYTNYTYVHYLEKVLSKKRDPTTHVGYLDEYYKGRSSKQPITAQYWNTVSNLFSDQLVKVSQDLPHVRFTLEIEYTRLVRQWNAMRDRLLVISAQQGDFSLGCQKTIEAAYLSRSSSRMVDVVNAMFSGGNICTGEDIQSLCKVIKSELHGASVDDNLVLLVANNVVRVIQMMIGKISVLANIGGDSLQFTATISIEQLRNIEMINIAAMMRDNIQNILDAQCITTAPRDIITNALEAANTFITNGLNAYYQSADHYLLNIILKMHAVNFNGVSTSTSLEPDAPCSPYIESLTRAVNHLNTSFLQRFTPYIVKEWRLKLASRLTELFVRHLSLVRPISDSGRLWITADMAQFEMIVAPLLNGARLAEIGPPYKALRSFRPLLFVETSQLDADSSSVQVVDPVVALHHLFSRGPTLLQSPYTHMK